jgi:hypothetical protein
MIINKNTVIKLCDFGISHSISELKSNFELIGGITNYLLLKIHMESSSQSHNGNHRFSQQSPAICSNSSYTCKPFYL